MMIRSDVDTSIKISQALAAPPLQFPEPEAQHLCALRLRHVLLRYGVGVWFGAVPGADGLFLPVESFYLQDALHTVLCVRFP